MRGRTAIASLITCLLLALPAMSKPRRMVKPRPKVTVEARGPSVLDEGVVSKLQVQPHTPATRGKWDLRRAGALPSHKPAKKQPARRQTVVAQNP